MALAATMWAMVNGDWNNTENSKVLGFHLFLLKNIRKQDMIGLHNRRTAKLVFNKMVI